MELPGRRCPLAEDGQVERLARAKPDYVLRMVGEIIAGFRVGKDCQPATVEGEELCDVAENVARHRQLHAPARVRANGPQVEVAHRDWKARLHGRGELFRPFDLFWVVIDVRVEVAD